ncbi:PTS sugar transporter subunit IIA [Mobilicoccus pelagius]|uniref:Putative phosphotransferase system enzyme II n=1 Tax=Mobilicoccus pelagius NBRC 104925 TaxID=1089455 RepID=H5UUN6_9MICO|nr:fructose PTS transporter subunit IIA [Mobilicoccus pelagius]GAB49444.1 putative phosphotransferase system enzyme II [Mobilicoccus pelagius NBRC 104925]
MNTPLITAELVVLGLEGDDRQEATRTLAQTLVDTGRVSDLDGFLADVAVREQQMATGLPGGIGIPHCRSAHVTTPSLAFARSEHGIDWGAEDGPAHLVFLIAVPDTGGEDHLAILAKLARKLMRAEFKEGLRRAPDVDTVVELVDREVVQA